MQFSTRHKASASIVLLAMACSASVAFATPPVQSAPTTDREKVSYAIGMQIGGNIAHSLESVKGEVDVSVVLRAIGTVVNGGKTQMTIPEAQAALTAFGSKMQARQQALAQKNLADGAAFLAANGKKPGVKTTASGLEYQVIKAGSGLKPKPTDSVKVTYTGTLLDGTVFDSTDKHGGVPAVFQVGGVIPGWTEGLQLMSVGSKYVFWIPGKLAYGDHPPGAPISPNATLKFEVELLSIGDK